MDGAASSPGRSWRRPAWRGLAAAAAAGVLAATGLAPTGFWWLALPALACVVAMVAAADRAPDRVWAAFAAGAGYFAAGLFWIVEPFLVDPARHGWMAPFALLLMALGGGAFWAAAGAVAGIGRTRATRAAAFALGLALSDLLRGYVFTGFPWALTGHMWIATPVAQAAAFAGPAGLSLLTLALAALPAAVAGRRRQALAAAAALAVLAAVWAGGALRLAAPDPAPRDPAVTVRLAQPDAPQHLKWREDMWRIFLQRLMDQTAAPSAPPPDLIVWPETAVPFLLEEAGPFLAQLAVTAGGVPVATGVQRSEGGRYFNSLAVIGGDGAVTHVYDKHHLVPFGEYVPWGDALARLGIGAFAARQGFGYAPGPGAAVLDLGRAGRVLPLICYEAVFPQDLRAAPERADWILQVTNDSWFGSLSGPYQHLDQARLRAIEQGLPLLRSANTGVSAAIDAKGRVIAAIPLDSEGHIDVAVPPALPPTLYARTGDLPVLAVILAGLAALVLLRRRPPVDLAGPSR